MIIMIESAVTWLLAVLAIPQIGLGSVFVVSFISATLLPLGSEPAVFAVITGMVGALSVKYLFNALKIPTDANGWMARGYALGTASHGIGAARALQVNADAGAYAGLALGLQVVLASLLIPLAFRLF